ncbi:MAG: hypothetical protein RBT49_06400 [Bacteroidales bacterium]|nr:hypothetical protein [Bacteroidales bacterium]
MKQNCVLEERRLYTDQRRSDLLKNARKLSISSEYTKMRLEVIAEMLEEKGEIWFANQLRNISDEIKTLE